MPQANHPRTVLLTTDHCPLSLRSLSSRGQGVIEYTILIAILVAVLVGMASYIQRSLAGKWRDVGDTFGSGRQYEPGVTAVTTVRQ